MKDAWIAGLLSLQQEHRLWTEVWGGTWFAESNTCPSAIRVSRGWPAENTIRYTSSQIRSDQINSNKQMCSLDATLSNCTAVHTMWAVYMLRWSLENIRLDQLVLQDTEACGGHASTCSKASPKTDRFGPCDTCARITRIMHHTSRASEDASSPGQSPRFVVLCASDTCDTHLCRCWNCGQAGRNAWWDLRHCPHAWRTSAYDCRRAGQYRSGLGPLRSQELLRTPHY